MSFFLFSIAQKGKNEIFLKSQNRKDVSLREFMYPIDIDFF